MGMEIATCSSGTTTMPVKGRWGVAAAGWGAATIGEGEGIASRAAVGSDE